MMLLTRLKPLFFLCGTLVLLASMPSCNTKTDEIQENEVVSDPARDRLYLPIQELEDPHPDAADKWMTVSEGLQVSFASLDVRFTKATVPQISQNPSWKGRAWKGERVATQVALWSKSDIDDVKVEIGEMKSDNGNILPAEKIRASFVTYVMADEFGEGCNKRKPADYDSFLVADVIDHFQSSMKVESNTVRPVWVSIDVPAGQPAGKYTGSINIIANGNSTPLSMELEILDNVLPPPSEWAFHLDLWQNPFAVARIYNVPLWSDEHFEVLRPHLEMLAEAGQKCITTGLINKPWNGQTFDHFQSMINWIHHKDGSWSYDYSVFDKYVEFVMSCGITEQINGYSMIPWHLTFEYYDESTDSMMALEAGPGSEEYNNHWSGMLQDFTLHLKEKNWLEKMTISMDERTEEAMKNTITLLKEVAPELKVSLAGGMHSDIQADLFDYCIASEHDYPEEMLAERKALSKHSTFYTCCVEEYPNTFTYSPPAESTWLAWYAAAQGYDGYLRWAYNSWVEKPLQDSRFRSWPSGDAFLIYPGARTSIRFERLREGIQDYEKIRILKEQWSNDPAGQEKLRELEEHLSNFVISNLSEVPAAQMINSGKELLNR